ncbi:hypothetical protein PIB30_066515 [Stylosanthes scabra]|uniref:Uncharacterized protein n=1 Tax=Stylosanthes scabra TaxID=79078 RepID=A0ABU6YLA1_9FABA|nr:hypothetical protein [Stylosanthes scabra]
MLLPDTKTSSGGFRFPKSSAQASRGRRRRLYSGQRERGRRNFLTELSWSSSVSVLSLFSLSFSQIKPTKFQLDRRWWSGSVLELLEGEWWQISTVTGGRRRQSRGRRRRTARAEWRTMDEWTRWAGSSDWTTLLREGEADPDRDLSDLTLPF